MELFTIQCTTCRARLKVKDASAIGAILACPKCHSMVQVVPPTGWHASSDGAETPGAITLVGIPRPAQPAGPIVAAVAVSKDSAGAQSAAVAQSAEVCPPALPARATAPSGRAAMAARISADWPLLAGGLAAGAVLGAAVWLVVGGGPSASDKPAATALPAEVAVARNALEPSDTSAAKGEAPAELPAGDPVPAAEIAAAPTTPASASPAEQPPDQGPSPQADPPSEPDRAPAAEAAAGARPSVPADVAKPALKLDPVAKLPASEQSPAGGSAASAASAADEPTTANLIDADVSPPEGAAPSGRASDPAADRSLSETEVAERLSVQLRSAKFISVPLAQFVEFIADVTALRITIDDAALAKAGKKRTAPVNVQLADTTAQDALRAAIEPLDLTCVLRGDRLVITVREARDAASR